MARRGRPKKDYTRCFDLHIRLSADEWKRLEDVALSSGKTKTDVLMIGLKLFMDRLKGGDK